MNRQVTYYICIPDCLKMNIIFYKKIIKCYFSYNTVLHILKGGLLLFAMFGIDNRMTKDMDVPKDKMLKVLNEILRINLKDRVKFAVIDITDISEDSEYNGNKYFKKDSR